MEPSILITGGAGYIGSHTAFYMVQKGYKVIILDDFSQNQEFNVSWATIIKADFADEKILEDIFTKNNIEVVMHFAAYIEVGESVKDPIKFYINNVAKTIQLLNTMLKHGIKKFIFSSSCAVYGNPEFLPLTENHSKNPISPYGKCKLIIEEILKDLNNSHGLQFVVLRYFNAAGALPEHALGEQHLQETHLIPLLLRSAYMNKPFSIYGSDYPTKDGTCIRDFIHVLDIADAHWLALQHLNEGKPSDYFNLGTGNGYSIKEIIQCIENVCRLKIQINYSKRREGDPAILIADATKANTILKWKSRFSDLEFIIRSTFAFEYRSKKNDNSTKFSLLNDQ
jgi:UDP-glucose 4-epimerase